MLDLRTRVVELPEQFGDSLAPIRVAAKHLVAAGAELEEEDGVFLIFRRPKIAPRAFAFVLYPGVNGNMIARYVQGCTSRRLNRPSRLLDEYRQVLRRLNGAALYQLDLFGIPPAMCADPPLLHRGARQPLDIATAEMNWSTPYKPGPSQFHSGSKHAGSAEKYQTRGPD